MKTRQVIRAIALLGMSVVLAMGMLSCKHGGIEQKRFEVDGVSFKMISITEVTAGTANNLGHADENDNYPHKASISFYMIGETEVTQELWEAVMGNNPSYFKGSDADKKVADGEIQGKRPVDTVNWYEAIVFCNKLTKLVYGNTTTECVYYADAGFNTVYESGTNVYMKMDKKGFRLPTEAEWEWAAKGGTEDKWAGTNKNDSHQLAEYAWYRGNSKTNSRTHEVAKLKPNGYGLYDMSGNAYEWCWDWYDNINEDQNLNKDYTGGAGSSRVYRGGNLYSKEHSCARAFRYYGTPGYSIIGVGFRLACRP